MAWENSSRSDHYLSLTRMSLWHSGAINNNANLFRNWPLTFIVVVQVARKQRRSRWLELGHCKVQRLRQDNGVDAVVGVLLTLLTTMMILMVVVVRADHVMRIKWVSSSNQQRHSFWRKWASICWGSHWTSSREWKDNTDTDTADDEVDHNKNTEKCIFHNDTSLQTTHTVRHCNIDTTRFIQHNNNSRFVQSGKFRRFPTVILALAHYVFCFIGINRRRRYLIEIAIHNLQSLNQHHRSRICKELN